MFFKEYLYLERAGERAKYLLVAVLRSNRVRKFLLTQPLEHTRQLTRKFAQFELLVARVVSQIRGLKRKQTFKLSIFFSRNKTSRRIKISRLRTRFKISTQKIFSGNLLGVLSKRFSGEFEANKAIFLAQIL